jgi:hypothetical protein
MGGGRPGEHRKCGCLKEHNEHKENTHMKIFASWMAWMALLAGTPVVAYGQGSSAAIQKRLVSEYALTKTTDDKTDIVTAGAVLVLQKDKLMMLAASAAVNPCTNIYKDGKLSPNGACKAGDTARHIPWFGSKIPGSDQAPASRYYVTGEKFWVTQIDVKDAGKDSVVTMQFFTDAVSDVRYSTSLAIPFKDGLPSPDEVVKRVEEVVTVASSENASAGGGQPAPAAPLPAAEAAPPPIAPPPPPPPDAAPPPTVSLGQTPDQVVGILGEPLRKAKVGVKEIYSYKDLKVTFVNGKVKDIQ